MAKETFAQPLPPMDSDAEFRRVVITVASGIAGVLAFLTGAVLAIWSYAVAGFDFSDWKFWVGYGAMIASLGLFSWLMQWNRHLDRVSPAIRRTLYGYNIFLGTVFLAATLVLANVLVAQYGHLFGIKSTYDWTSQRMFTLSPVTRQQLDALQKPVKFIALYQRGTALSAPLEQLLELYAQASKQVTFEFVDPLADRIATEDLFKKYPAAQTREPTVIVTYGTGDPPPHKVVKNGDIHKAKLEEMDMRGRMGGDTEFHGENALTSAIRSLVDDKKTNLYFTTGHGEKDLGVSSTRDVDGVGLLKQRFTDLNIKAESVNLLKSEVPADANLLVIAGPKRAMQPAELDKLRDFMERRDSKNERTSRLIVLFDSPPELRRGEPHDAGLGEFLAGYQVQVKDNIVYDRTTPFGRPDQIAVVVSSDAAAHPIVEPLKNDFVALIQAREIAPIQPATPPGAPPPPNKLEATKLFASSEQPYSWGESQYTEAASPTDGKDSMGPVCLGVAVSEQEQAAPSPHSFGGPPPPPSKSSPRLVVFGDATFISNPLISQFPQNEDLFLNAVNWLGGRVTDIGIQPRVRKALTLNLELARYYTIIFEPMFQVLAIAGFMAGLVWVVRTERFQLLWLPISGTVVVVLLYALLLRLFAGPITAPLKVSIMRLALTCVILWTVGFAFRLLQSRPARAVQP